MKTLKYNLLIASENPLIMSDLANYLQFNFGTELVVFNLTKNDNILDQIKEDTHIVIFDKNLGIDETPNLNELIALSRPNVHLISYSFNEEIKNKIDEFRNQKIEAQRNLKKSKKQIHSLIHKAAVYPIHFLTEEFRIKKFVAIFILTFLTVGIASMVGYYLV